MRIVNRKQVSVGPSGAALARVSKILEAVETLSVVVLIREFTAHHVLLVETVIDLDVKLIVEALVCT